MKVYVDLVSQPCRGLVMFCRKSGIDVDVEEIRLMKGEHMREPFTNISCMKTVVDLFGFIASTCVTL
jgi:hypothetical protein